MVDPARRRSLRLRITASVLSALVALLLGEAFVRLAGQPSSWQTTSELNEYRFRVRRGEIHDEVARRWLQEQFSMGLPGTNAATPIDRPSPTLGWVPSASFRSPSVNTSSIGSRGPREYPLAKPPGEKRIVVVGDSFTWGEGVADDETYSTRLERRLKDVSVVNLGVHGYGVDQAFLRLGESGFGLAPDLVILGLFAVDPKRDLETFTDYAKPRFRVRDDRLELTNVPVPPPEQLPNGLPAWWVPRLWRYAERALGGDAARLESVQLLLALLDAFDAACRAHGARFLVLLMGASEPTSWRAPLPVETAATNWAERSGTPLVDMRAHFLERTPAERQAVWPQGVRNPHWSPRAHELCAQALEGAIASAHALEASQNAGR